MGIPFLGNPYAQTVDEYPKPMPSPGVPPDFTPVNVPISCYWLPYVAGACKALLQEAAWKSTDPADLQRTLGWSDDLLAIIAAANAGSGCASLEPPFACPYDFTLGDEGWGIELFSGFTGNEFGHYEAGAGFRPNVVIRDSDLSVYQELNVALVFASPATVVDASMVFDFYKGTISPSVYCFIRLWNGGTVVASTTPLNDTLPDGSSQTMAIPHGPWTATSIEVQLCSAHYSAGAGSTGDCLLRNVSIVGVGDSPCSEL